MEGMEEGGAQKVKVVEYWRWQVLKHLSAGVNIRGRAKLLHLLACASMHGSVPTSYEPEVKSERVLETRNRAMHT